MKVRHKKTESNNQNPTCICSISLSYGKQILPLKSTVDLMKNGFSLISMRFRYEAVSLLCSREKVKLDAIVPVPHAGVFLANCWVEQRNEKLWLAFGSNKYDSSDACFARGEVIEKKEYNTIILIDEALISGVTIQTAIKSLKSHGVKKIYVRTLLPPYMNKCPYSVIAHSPKLDVNSDVAEFLGADGFSCLSKKDILSLNICPYICVDCLCDNAGL